MPHEALVRIFAENLPEELAHEVTAGDGLKKQFRFEMSNQEFDVMQWQCIQQLQQVARDSYRYDCFASRTTTYTGGGSCFSLSMGVGKDYHYVITGNCVGDEANGVAFVWINPTNRDS